MKGDLKKMKWKTTSKKRKTTSKKNEMENDLKKMEDDLKKVNKRKTTTSTMKKLTLKGCDIIVN
jgi:hypothetical protein